MCSSRTPTSIPVCTYFSAALSFSFPLVTKAMLQSTHRANPSFTSSSAMLPACGKHNNIIMCISSFTLSAPYTSQSTNPGKANRNISFNNEDIIYRCTVHLHVKFYTTAPQIHMYMYMYSLVPRLSLVERSGQGKVGEVEEVTQKR